MTVRSSDEASGKASPRRRPTWLWWLGGSALAACGLYFLYLREAQTWRPDSDAAAIALQGWDMLHGDLLLHGWWLADLSFYSTELPQYMLVEAARGLTPQIVHVCAALTYTLLVLVAALLAKGRATGREGVARALLAAGLMLSPGLFRGTNALLSSPDHTGTALPVLLIVLLLDRAEQWKRRWPVPAAVFVMLLWVQIGDPLGTYVAAVPLALVGVFRLASAIWRRGLRPEWWYNLALAVAAAGSVPLASALVTAIRSAGGYTVAPITGPLVATWPEVPGHALATGQSVLVLFGADFFGQPSQTQAALAYLHLLGVAVAAVALLTGIFWFFTRLDLAGQVLVTATLVLIGAGVFSTHLPDVTFAHEIAPLLPLAAALAGRQFGGWLSRARLRPGLLAAGLAAYLGALCYYATAAPVPAQNQSAADWLVAHNLTYGLAGYWQADSITFDSGGRVTVVPLAPGRINAYQWESQATWFDPGLHYANFVITNAPSWIWSHQFGRPAQTYQYQQYIIMVWNKNLLPLVGPGIG